MPTQTSPAPIRLVAVLGAGQMGAAAAVLFRRAGYQVTLWARRLEGLEAARPVIHGQERFLDEHFGPVSLNAGRIEFHSSLEAADAAADAVLECVAEDMGQKIEVLKRLRGCKERGALVMSCTSALSISNMARGSGMQSVLVGAHFWNPPHLIPVVEVIAGDATPPEQVERATALLLAAGKVPVKCADVPGFIGNRLMHAMWREALALVDAGVCSPEDIDRVVRGTFALRLPALGPMENIDLVGLPLVNSVQSYLFPDLATNAAPSRALTDRLARGDSGMKAGRGFYDWSKRDPAATVALRDKQIVRQLQFLREQEASNS